MKEKRNEKEKKEKRGGRRGRREGRCDEGSEERRPAGDFVLGKYRKTEDPASALGKHKRNTRTGTPARTQKKKEEPAPCSWNYRTPKPFPARIPVPDLACHSSSPTIAPVWL